MTDAEGLLGLSALSAADFALLGGLLALMFWMGWYFGRREADTQDFFLGARRIPWWVACLSFVATEISAMTIIGVPATGFRENWNYAQFFIGSAAARVVVAYLFIPAFYKTRCTTIYEYLRHRFGPRTQVAATLLFFVTRILASAVRLMAACLAVSVLLGWPIVPVIALFTAVGILYIGYGGIKAVVWTNVLQALTFIAAGLSTVAFILWSVPGGLPAAWAAASEAGRLEVWRWGPPLSEPGWLGKFLSDPNILWIAVLNGFFGSMAAFGTDHEMMQKLLTVETRRESQKTILMSIGGSFFVLMLFLAVGACLFSFYSVHPELPLPVQLDKIYPHFASTAMPAVLRGLVLSAIVMASIDSPLSSLSAVFVTDLYRPLVRPSAPERHYLWVSRLSVAGFALVLAAIAYWFSFFDKILWLAFKIGGITYGSLLGVFLLGLLTEVRSDRANAAAMAVMAAVNAVLLCLIEVKVLALGWSWLLLLGTAGTMGLSRLAAPWLDGRKA